MTKRTVTILAAVFVALVALIALTRYLDRRVALPAKPPVDLAVEEKSADKVTITSADDAVTLVKVGGTWRLGDKADATGTPVATVAATQIQALFDGLKAARFERLVVRETKDLKDYGLDKAAARTVVISSGETTLVAFLLGGPSDVPGSDYLQAAGDKAVWVVSGDLKTLTDPNPAAWRPQPEASGEATAPTAPGGPSGPGGPGGPGSPDDVGPIPDLPDIPDGKAPPGP